MCGDVTLGGCSDGQRDAVKYIRVAPWSLIDPSIDRDRTEDEATWLRSLSRSTPGRVCPSCGRPTLHRNGLKAYYCVCCEARSVTRDQT